MSAPLAPRRPRLLAVTLASALLASGLAAPTAHAGDPAQVERIAGRDRYAVAAESALYFEDAPVDTVYIASGEVYADALTAGPAAAVAEAGDGKLLLTRQGFLPEATVSALKTLRPRHIVVVGGPSTVSDAVTAQLRPYALESVTRITAPDRYGVSAQMSKTANPYGTETVYLASGEIYSDAVSASGVAAASGSPVLLTRQGALPQAVKTELDRLDPVRIVVVGGPTTVSDAVLRAASPFADEGAVRIGGKDRYEVSVHLADDLGHQFAEWSEDGQPALGSVSVAGGTAWADALAASNLLQPVVLTGRDALAPSIPPMLTRNGVFVVTIVGGTPSVSSSVEKKIVSALPSMS